MGWNRKPQDIGYAWKDFRDGIAIGVFFFVVNSLSPIFVGFTRGDTTHTRYGGTGRFTMQLCDDDDGRR